ncbi:unnamed protein product, partial [Allacma fusca]
MDTKNQIKAVNQLGKHLRSNCDKILDKSIPFVIDSALLWFINEAIQSLLSNDATLFPESNNGFYDYVMFLSDFFEQTPSLCITLTEAIKGVNSIPGNLDLIYFRSLHFLELRKIPPHMVTSLHAIKTNLRKLKCSRCLDSLSEVLCPQHSGNNNNGHVPSSTSISLVWPELRDIDFSFNRISEVDAKSVENFELTPSVENLNLSRNKIYSVNDLFSRVLTSLKVLNLNYNQLKSIPAIPPNVKTLLLAHNYITTLTCATFSSLKNLEILDLSSNVIADENELDQLGNLRYLKSMMLLGNPISYLENYRHSVCCNINRLVLNRTFVLDNKKLSVSEVRRALEFTKHHKFVPFNVAAAPTDVPGSTNSTVQGQFKEEISNFSDDSLIFYPCTSTAAEWSNTPESGHSGPSTDTSSNVTLKSPEEFRFTALGPTSFTSAEIFSDPDDKSIEFHYFQNGQMFKLAILDNYLYEVDRQGSSVLAKWDLKSLETLTDEKFMSETETVEFRLTFDTMKKNLRERTYIMTNKDFSRFDEAIGPFLEFKTMQEFSEAFQCLKCNAQFSKCLADKTVIDEGGIVREVPICNNPDCRSEQLVVLDSAPLPNNQCLNVESELPRLSPARSASPVSGTQTAAKPIFDFRFFRLPLASSTPKTQSGVFPQTTHDDLNTSDQLVSEAVFDNGVSGSESQSNFKSSSEPTSLTAINKSESDIETLSCNSSSIEVIANTGDSGSGSDIVEVPEAVELEAPEISQKLHKSPGVTMTDSTSSGSCAESVCTAYETKKAATSTQSSANHHNSPSKFSGSMVTSFSNSFSSTATLTNVTYNSPRHRLVTCPVRYDYENFSKVDHRLQLFCEISVFKGSDERLLALAKVLVISDSSQYSGIVIFSNKKCYVYKIVGLEGDKPESWLQKVKSYGLDKLIGINVLIGHHGVGIELQGKYYALVFRDSNRTSRFLECFLNDICGEMSLPPMVRDYNQTHKAFLSPTNSVVYFGVLQYASCENEKTLTAAILLTDVEVILITDLTWMGATREGNVVASQVQKLTSLRQV